MKNRIYKTFQWMMFASYLVVASVCVVLLVTIALAPGTPALIAVLVLAIACAVIGATGATAMYVVEELRKR